MDNPFLKGLELYLEKYQKDKREKLIRIHGEQFIFEENQIRELLGKTSYFHGTGAYHHEYSQDKYSGDYTGIKNTLESILYEGLVPQKDLFNLIFETGSDKSISLSKNNIYSRCYADLFFEEGKGLEYAYGSPRFWGIMVFGNMINKQLEVSIDSFIHNHRLRKSASSDEKIRLKKRAALDIMYERWTNNFRKDGKLKGKAFISVPGAKSDIENNFGIIFGIDNQAVKPLPIKYDSISLFETRTATLIKPESFTHIQVPINNIEEAQRIASYYTANLPIIPLEFVELLRYKDGIIKAMSFEN